MEVRRQAEPTAPNPEAYQLYLEAVRLWGLRDATSLSRRQQLLQRGIALQPDFARAHAAMGFVLSVRSTEIKDPLSGEGRALNEQALTWAGTCPLPDPGLAEGYAAKGNALENLGRWTECKEAYRRSIELDPNFATARQWYARNLAEEGYIEEAMLQLKRAVDSIRWRHVFWIITARILSGCGDTRKPSRSSIGRWRSNPIWRKP